MHKLNQCSTGTKDLLQQRFFEQVKLTNNIPDHLLANQIATILSKEKSAIYKRLNGQTALSLDDLELLAQHFQFSLDELLFGARTDLSVGHAIIPKDIRRYDDFLNCLLNDLKQWKKFPEKKIWYAAEELPIFYYFLHEGLAKFKLYFWGITVWNITGLKKQKFYLRSVDNSKQLMDELLTIYMKIPSIEFWGQRIISNTLRQIKYILSCDLFANPKDALTLIDQLNTLWQQLKEMLDTGKKQFSTTKGLLVEAPLQVYCNEVITTPSTMLLDNESNPTIYRESEYPSIMKYTAQKYFDETQHWFKQIQLHSLLISESGYRNSISYKSKVESTTEELKMEINKMILD